MESNRWKRFTTKGGCEFLDLLWGLQGGIWWGEDKNCDGI